MYVRTKEYIAAHLLTCMIALILLKIVQKKIIASNKIEMNPDVHWTTGLSGHRIQEALLRWKVDLLLNDLYRFMDVDDADLKLILDSFNIEIPKKLYRRGELKKDKNKYKSLQIDKCVSTILFL